MLLHSLGEALQPFYETEREPETETELPPMSKQEMEEFYEAVWEYARVYDQEGITFLIAQAKAYRLSGDEKERVRQIAECARQSDWNALKNLLKDRQA